MNKVYIAIIIVVFALFVLRDYAANMGEPNQPKEFFLKEPVLFELVNDYRLKKDLPPLKKSIMTCGIASIRLDEVMYDWSHNGFFSLTESNDNWQYSKVGENLSRHWESERDTLDEWLSSPKHKENLDYPYTESCIQCEGTVCVQIFAK